MSEWQPIETAPKGVVVLVSDPNWLTPLTACFYEFPPGSGERWRYCWDEGDKYGRLNPTHWMELPPKAPE